MTASMSVYLPLLGGYDGPFPMKAFLKRYFGVELRYGRQPLSPSPSPSPPAATSTTATPQRLLYLECSSAFAVSVYVAKGAVAPPLQASSAPTRDASASPSPLSALRQQQRHPSLLFTNAVLRHPMFEALFSFLGPAATAFTLARCPIVAQFEPVGGGLQVLGPPLYSTAAGAVDPDVSRRKHFHDSLLPSSASRGRRRPREWEAKASEGEGGAPKLSRTEDNAQRAVSTIRPLSSSALLGRTEVPRRALIYGPHCAASLVPEGSRTDAGALEEGWFEELWLRRHPNSRDCLVTSCLSPAQCRRTRRRLFRCRQEKASRAKEERTNREEEEEEEGEEVHAEDIRDDVLSSLFPCSLGQDDSHESTPFLRDHLRALVGEVVHQCSSMDLRGAALRHTAYLERRCAHFLAEGSRRRCLSSVSAAPIGLGDLVAPVDVVVSYLMDLLCRLRYKRTGNHNSGSTSFWGVDEVSAEAVLAAVRDALCAWLTVSASSTGAVFTLSAFLNCVPVGRVPWLASLFTDSSTAKGRQRRSMLQQRVFLQFVFFLSQHVIPTFVRQTFCVTWGSKGGGGANTLLFVPTAVWRRLLRRQIHSSRRNRGRERRVAAVAAAAAASDALQPVQLEPVADGAVGACGEQGGEGGCQGVLYATVRFHPDKKKLRPIAMVRWGSHRSLRVMAKGLCSRYSARYRLAARLAADLGLLDLCLGTPPRAPLAAGSAAGRLHRQRSTSTLLRLALLCLIHGVEEGQRLDRAGEGAGERPYSMAHFPVLRTNSSHAEEYTELRIFLSALRRLQRETEEEEEGEQSRRGGGGGGSLTLSFVRGDAAQCYDRLSQDAVMHWVEELVSHEQYYLVDFQSLRGSVAGESVWCRADEESGASLPSAQRLPWRKMVSDADVAAGVLPGIPAGWVVQESGYHEGRSRGFSARQHEDSTGCCPGDTRVLQGAYIRSVLRQHVQDHLLSIDGHLYRQHRGLLQGSPVAMLLCDVLLLHVDASLAGVLVEHHEPSLQLRRVDDVLVVSASPVAAQRCWQAMRTGWPAVGYVCQEEKLLLVSSPFRADGERHPSTGVERSTVPSVPWCGLLLHPQDFSISVEWARLASQQSSITATTVALCRANHRGSLQGVGSCLLHGTHRLLRVVQLRIPATALCRVLNRKERVLQTVYEAALVWAKWLSGVLFSLLVVPLFSSSSASSERLRTARAAARGRRRASVALSTVSSLLVRPVRACVQRLCQLLSRHQRFLQARGSFCSDITRADVWVCVSTALSCALCRGHRLPSSSSPLLRPPHATCCGFGRRGLWWRLRQVASRLAAQRAALARKECQDTPTAVKLLWPTHSPAAEPREKDGTRVVGPFACSAWSATRSLQ